MAYKTIIRDNKHLKFVRQLECVLCGSPFVTVGFCLCVVHIIGCNTRLVRGHFGKEKTHILYVQNYTN